MFRRCYKSVTIMLNRGVRGLNHMARTAIGKVREALELAREAAKIAKLDAAAAETFREIARGLLKRASTQFRRKFAARKTRK